MSSPETPWDRLAAAARRAPGETDASAPYGFATRVVATAFTENRKRFSLFERFSWRALGVAGLLALVSLAANYPLIASSGSGDEELPADETTAVELLGIS